MHQRRTADPSVEPRLPRRTLLHFSVAGVVAGCLLAGPGGQARADAPTPTAASLDLTSYQGTVEVAAKNRAGKLVMGSVSFVREHGSWKFVDQSWAAA